MSAPFIALAGVDTLYLNVYYADSERFTRINQPLDAGLQEQFNALQQQAKSTRQDVATPWTIYKQPLHMLSHGSGKQWYWILHNDLVNVQIGNGDHRGLIAYVRVASEYLWAVNALHVVLNDIRVLTHHIFAHEMYLTPSSIDLCADVANWPIETLDHAAIVSRARKHRVKFDKDSLMLPGEVVYHGRKTGTIYIGERTSPVHAKVYDKLKEIKDGGNKKSWFLDLYGRNGHDGKAPVARWEVSLKREALHDLDIETCDDLVNNLKGLWAYAVGSKTVKPWMRYTVPTNDHIQTRWPLHPHWPIVQHAFDSLSNEPAHDLIRLKKQQVSMEANTASLAGYLSSHGVLQSKRDGVSIADMALETTLNDLYEEIEKRLQDKGVSFQQLLQAKQRRYYLREEKTREVVKKRFKSVLNDDKDTIKEEIEP